MSVIQPLSLINPGWNTTVDSITVTYPDTVTEVYRYRTGGASGTIVLTVTVVYVDATKAAITSVVRT